MAKGWKSVDLPEHLYWALQKILDHPQDTIHFQSTAQVVRDAVTAYILRWHTFAALLSYDPKPAQCKACPEEIRLIPLEEGGRITFVEWGHRSSCKYHRANREAAALAPHRKETRMDWQQFFTPRATELSHVTDAIHALDRAAAMQEGIKRLRRKDRRRRDD